MHFFLKAIILCTLCLTTSVSVFSEKLGIKDILDLTERLQRMKQQKALQEQLREQQLFRPSQEEKDAIATFYKSQGIYRCLMGM